MVWVVVIVGIGVLGLAAVAASGKLGAMPPPVSSRPVGRLPQGELTGETLDAVRFRTTSAGNGYAPAEVDALLDEAIAGTLTVADLDALDLPIAKAKGYAFDEVDQVLDEIRAHLGAAEPARDRVAADALGVGPADGVGVADADLAHVDPVLPGGVVAPDGEGEQGSPWSPTEPLEPRRDDDADAGEVPREAPEPRREPPADAGPAKSAE